VYTCAPRLIAEQGDAGQLRFHWVAMARSAFLLAVFPRPPNLFLRDVASAFLLLPFSKRVIGHHPLTLPMLRRLGPRVAP
jgi:hypothetical protein